MREHPRFPGYVVRRDGVIVSPRGRQLATYTNDEGYLKTKLIGADGKRTNVFVHVLVAEVWRRGRTDEKRYVRHLDGDRKNCAASNLRWGTYAENLWDQRRHGTLSRPGRKLTPGQVRSIRRSPLTPPRLARRYGISISHARDVKNGRRHGGLRGRSR